MFAAAMADNARRRSAPGCSTPPPARSRSRPGIDQRQRAAGRSPPADRAEPAPVLAPCAAMHRGADALPRRTPAPKQRPGHADPQATHSGSVERGDLYVLDRPINGAGRVARIVPGHRRRAPLGTVGGASGRARRAWSRLEAYATMTPARHAAVGRLETGHAAERGRLAHRAAGVASRSRTRPRCRRRLAAAEPPDDPPGTRARSQGLRTAP
jgi:hypothetical protein